MALIPSLWYLHELRQSNLDQQLIHAVMTHDVAAASSALERGASANALLNDAPHASLWAWFLDTSMRAWKPHRPNNHGWHPPVILLVYAMGECPIASSQLDMIKVLNRYGADLNAEDLHGSVLRTAVQQDDVPSVTYLLERGADPNHACAGDRTPLFDASVGCARLLIAHGADVNARYDALPDPMSPLDSAIRADDVNRVRFLLQHGADVTIKSREEDGATLLHHAVYCKINSVPITQLLLQYGADPKVRDSLGTTPLEDALSNHRSETVTLLAHEVVVPSVGRPRRVNGRR